MLTSVREHGQGLVEYAFLILLIALVVIAVLLILGPIIGNVFSKLNNKLPTY
jgi:pilus assembly protein Flp/PilA